MAWLTGWGKQKLHPVTGSTDGAKTNYTIKLTVYYGSGTEGSGVIYCDSFCKTDFSDLRFTSDDGTTLLPHWIESKTDSTSAVVWVKIPSLPASPTVTNIYLYCGKADATSNVSIANTFPLHGEDFETTPVIFEPPFTNAASPLSIATYDGSNQPIHPSVVRIPGGWNGYEYWMVVTPYPFQNDDYENPCLYGSNDMTTWITLDTISGGQITNPIDPWPGGSLFNFDPALVYDPTADNLRVYYSGGLMRTVSESGGVWTVGAEQLVTTGIPAGIKSPSYVRINATTWHCWYQLESISGSKIGHAVSTDGITWTGAASCTFSPKSVAADLLPWHMDVQYIASKNEYWICFHPPTGLGAYTTYYMGRITPGAETTILVYSQVALWPVAGGWDEVLYRAAIVYNEITDQMGLCYSAYNATSLVWKTGWSGWVDYSAVTAVMTADPYGWKHSPIGSQVRVVASPAAGSGTKALRIKGQSGGLSEPYTLKAFTGGVGNARYVGRFYDDGASSPALALIRLNGPENLRIGVMTDASSTQYVINTKTYTYVTSSGTGTAPKNRSTGWHTVECEQLTTGAVKVWIDGTLIFNQTGYGATPFANAGMQMYYNNTTYLDYQFIRPYTANEPVQGASGVWTDEPSTGDPQTISFGALSATTYGALPITLTATASSGLPVSYTSSNTAVATVSGTAVTIVGVGSTNITASQSGDGTYAAATPVVQALTVAKAEQVISISAPRYTLPTDAPFAVSATATSGLACTLSILSGPATILAGTVTLTGTLGDVVIRAVQAGDGNYNAAANTDWTVGVVEVIPQTAGRFGFGFGFGFNF